jgi:hypothetical protein
MSKAVTIVALALAAAATLVLAGTGGAADAGCNAGTTKFGGSPARVFCGSATATVRVGAKTFSFRNGSCEATSDYLTLNLGTIVIGSPSKRRPDYFGLTVGRLPVGGGKPAGKDGTYSGAVVSAVHRGEAYAVGGASVTLAGGRTRGTFTGRLVGSAVRVSGSFAC